MTTQPREPVAEEPDGLRPTPEEHKQAAKEAEDRLLRLAADFDNFRKRARQEQADTIAYATSGLLAKLLPVLDDFRRTIDHAPEGVDEGWRKGLELAVQHLEGLLQGQGVEYIEAVGSPFDPAFHEAIGTEDSDEHPEDTVIAELRRGYRLGDKVLRPALVKVSRHSPVTPPQD